MQTECAHFYLTKKDMQSVQYMQIAENKQHM